MKVLVTGGSGRIGRYVVDELVKAITGSQSMVSAERIKRKLGWQPKYSWRDFVGC